MKEVSGAIEDSENVEQSLLQELLSTCETVFVKKLSLNDRDWSRLRNKHQAGVYVPRTERDSGFFPDLKNKLRTGKDADGKPIREAFFQTEWPQFGVTDQSRLVHYASKGEETHLTGLPKEAFRELAPASFLVIGKSSDGNKNPIFKCITLDSTSESATSLIDVLSIEPDFVSAIRHPLKLAAQVKKVTLTFLELVIRAYHDGKLVEFAAKHSTLPSTNSLATLARQQYLSRTGLKNFDPFTIRKPGDVIRQVSRGDEYEIFRDLQMKAKSVELVSMIVGTNPATASIERIITALVTDYPKIDALLLSASQQRKSRAGYSFEFQIEQMLIDGCIAYDKQVVIEAKKRPDFILPSFDFFKSVNRKKSDVIVLSAKTTLRERWKQVQREIGNSDLFLATVDENIASNAIDDMGSIGITLVVPESLKASDTTEYKKHKSVISFKSFFEFEVKKKRMPTWNRKGIYPRVVP
ncbi:MAG: type II restriction endonuclease [Betaproteobacteria bacterium]